jgi:predicted DNA binding CopG/RHH family protein
MLTYMGKMGRPFKSDSDRRKKSITLRLTSTEVDAVDVAAKKSGLTRSKWLRKVLTEALNVIQ